MKPAKDKFKTGQVNGLRVEDFERVYSAYSAAVYRLCLLYMRDRSAAEDVAQDCFVKLLGRGGFESEGHVKAWLLTVARNLCFNALKKAKKCVPLRYGENGATAESEGRAVMEEVYKLNPEDRAAVYLFYYEGYSSKETARLMESTDAAVRARLKRARKTLKDILEEGQ